MTRSLGSDEPLKLLCDLFTRLSLWGLSPVLVEKRQFMNANLRVYHVHVRIYMS